MLREIGGFSVEYLVTHSVVPARAEEINDNLSHPALSLARARSDDFLNVFPTQDTVP